MTDLKSPGSIQAKENEFRVRLPDHPHTEFIVSITSHPEYCRIETKDQRGSRMTFIPWDLIPYMSILRNRVPREASHEKET